jgi:DNA-binding transcriptional LysR family regulator
MRMLSIERFWPWLPAFRVIAETEHVGRAAKVLHISASALSRTLRQLEDAVGEPLFDRVGTGLRLNAAGAALLTATRDAMRVVDDGASQAKRAAVVLQMGAIDAAQFVVAAACADATFADGPARIDVLHLESENGGKAIARGALDLAIVDGEAKAPTWLVRAQLPPVPRSVWAAPGQARPATSVRSDLTSVALASRAAVLPDALGRTIGWRRVEAAAPLCCDALRRPRAGNGSALDRALDAVVAALVGALERAPSLPSG